MPGKLPASGYFPLGLRSRAYGCPDQLDWPATVLTELANVPIAGA